MDSIVNKIRNHIGIIISFIGFVLLSIITFGDLGEVLSSKYWQNVLQNISSIGLSSIALTVIQVTIKQGIAEEALRRGLNSETTAQKYIEHKQIMTDCRSKSIYLGHFLDEYNERKTKERKRTFIIQNNYKTEEDFFANAPKRIVKRYLKICHCVTTDRIVWATTTVKYDSHGNVKTLAEHRRNRAINGAIWGLFAMFVVSLIARGLFFEKSDVPFIQKLIKFCMYILAIALFSIPAMIQEYEKGKFGVPNDLSSINLIWEEFKCWEVPQWVKDEVATQKLTNMEVANIEKQENINIRATLQTQSTQI